MMYRSTVQNTIIGTHELINVVKHPAPASPFTNIGDEQIAALTELVDTFRKIKKSTVILKFH